MRRVHLVGSKNAWLGPKRTGAEALILKQLLRLSVR